jgi:hypothetical protein
MTDEGFENFEKNFLNKGYNTLKNINWKSNNNIDTPIGFLPGN